MHVCAHVQACAGCLSCSLFAPASAAAEEVERALAGLRYGCVALNGWSVLGYMAACKGAPTTAPWLLPLDCTAP